MCSIIVHQFKQAILQGKYDDYNTYTVCPIKFTESNTEALCAKVINLNLNLTIFHMIDNFIFMQDYAG